MSVIEVKFRKGGRDCPPLNAALADDGAARSCVRLDRAVSNSVSDSPQEGHAPRFLHASESLGETLLRQRNDAIFWHGWLHGFAFGVLIVLIVALLGWPG